MCWQQQDTVKTSLSLLGFHLPALQGHYTRPTGGRTKAEGMSACCWSLMDPMEKRSERKEPCKQVTDTEEGVEGLFISSVHFMSPGLHSMYFQ